MRRGMIVSRLVLGCVLACVRGSVLGCGSSPAPATSSACPAAAAIVAESDYTSSVVDSIQLDGGGQLTHPGADLGTDPALASSFGHVFFVNRDEGIVFALDACGGATAKFLVNDPAHAGSSNPQDVARTSDGSLWVTRYDVPSIAIVTNGALAGAIDLSSYDPDGNPQAATMHIVAVNGVPKAFVALERLDTNLKPTQTSQMLRIDVATQHPEATIDLVGRDPFNAPGAMAEDLGVLYLAESGSFDSAREDLAGIERFDTATSTTRLLVHEADLGASAVEVAVSGKCGAALVADATPQVNRVSLVTFDADAGTVLAKNVLGPSADFDNGLRGLAWAAGGDVLLVGDRARAAGGFPVHVFDRDDACTLHERADIVFVAQKPIGVRSAS